jgi:hypothetical protein
MGYRSAFGIMTIVLLLAVGFGFGAGAEKRRIYALPLVEVNEFLDEIALPELVFAERARTAKHWRENEQVSVWTLQSSEDEEMFRLTATTTVDKKGTLVVVAVGPPETNKRDEIKKMLDANPAYRDLFGSGLAEQIDSKLRNRPFSIANISRATTRVALVSGPMKAAMRSAIDEEAVDRAKEDRKQYDRLYERR